MNNLNLCMEANNLSNYDLLAFILDVCKMFVIVISLNGSIFISKLFPPTYITCRLNWLDLAILWKRWS